MEFLTLLLVIGAFVAISMTVMAVGLLQNKTFRSCGCSSITFNGEKIKCPGCTDPDPKDEEPATCCGGQKQSCGASAKA